MFNIFNRVKESVQEHFEEQYEGTYLRPRLVEIGLLQEEPPVPPVTSEPELATSE